MGVAPGRVLDYRTCAPTILHVQSKTAYSYLLLNFWTSLPYRKVSSYHLLPSYDVITGGGTE